MNKLQQTLLNRIRANGSTTVRVYADGRGRYTWRAAESLRAQGIVNFRGVRIPDNADFVARSVYLRPVTD